MKYVRYGHGYRVLLDQLAQLARLSQDDENVGVVILFGSTARLTPNNESDADLLFLCHDTRAFIAPAEGRGMSLLGEITRPGEEWGLIPVVSDLCASDLPPALVANIAREGVLVYQQPGVTLPAAFVQVQPYASWFGHVVLALKKLTVAPPL